MKNKCEFCNEDSRAPFIIDENVDVFINDTNQLEIITHSNQFETPVSTFDLNYCPECGKKLKKVK